jgi:hypothetical protein
MAALSSPILLFQQVEMELTKNRSTIESRIVQHKYLETLLDMIWCLRVFIQSYWISRLAWCG